MQELFYQLLGYLKAIWNKRWHVMFVSWLICLIGWGVVFVLPDQYESKAKIYIDTDSLLKPLLEGLTVEYNANQQVTLMVRTLLTRPNVEKIIRLSDLDLTVNDDIELDKLIEHLQKSIQFSKTQQGKRAPNVYGLSYKNISPQVAQTVLQSVITVFIENSIGDSKEDSNAAKLFLNKKVKEYEARLLKSENKLKDFKQKNMGMLPSSGQGYYSRMAQAKNNLDESKLELREAEKRQSAIRKERSSIVATLKATDSNISTSYDERIETLNKNLDDLLLNYTESHPDVLAARRLIEGLKIKQQQEIAELKKSPSGGVASTLESNSSYQELNAAYGEAKAVTESLKVRVKEYESRYNKLQKLINTIPEIEAQLTALNRDYDITYKKYQEFLERRESASISESVDQTTESVQFKVLEAPRVENSPVGPNRILLSSAVLIVGIIGGLGFAFLLSQINPVVTSGKELSEITGLPVFGVVSANDSPVQRKRRSLMVYSYMSLSLVLLLCYGALIGWYLMAQLA
ncbi:MAG: Wzz/FepE/Etk N-terminal domain-containing protein [Gammaproteobacteria bacterium]|nr:Wzz/FepE/Etk N-terminal domain-containing protein [Gammaproteobacteria bacterium]